VNIDIKKIIRMVVIAFSFLSLTYLYGVDMRDAQQYIFMLGCMALFGFLLDNIWISCFLWWTIFLQVFFKNGAGSVYLSNVFFGCILYYLVKVAFKKEHIDTFINAILWLVVLNIGYMSIQLLGYDWIYKLGMFTTEGFKGYVHATDPAGFMGFKACMGMLMAMAVPLLATRQSKWALAASLLLFIPLYLSQASICILAAIVGLIWVIWHKTMWTYRKFLVFLLIGLMVLGMFLFYIFKVDNPDSSMKLRLVAWQGILQDTVIHPVTGWGLDSFRNITETKKHLYGINLTQMITQKGTHMDYFDNPHNLYISLMFEWGIVGIIILIGLLRRWGLQYAKAIKEPNMIALAGFLLVTLVISIAQFPMFLSRLVVLVVPCVALWEVNCRD
jgi:O-antigen ligase